MEEDDRFQDAERKIWEVHHSGQPMLGRAADGGGDEDDDVILEGAGAGCEFSKNPKCPITGLDVSHGPDLLYVRAGRRCAHQHRAGTGMHAMVEVYKGA